MTRTLTAAIFMALLAAPAAAQQGYAGSTSSSSASSGGSSCRPIGDTGRICCDNCGGGWPAAKDPVDVPAPPAVLLFGAAVMALAARHRASMR